MSFDSELFHSAIKYLSGGNVHICRLCFASTEESGVCLDNYVTLDYAHCQGNLSFYEMFIDLGVNLESSLPQEICLDCATNTVNSYLFKKLCKFSNEQWNLMSDRLAKRLVLADNIKSNVKSLYLVLNDAEPILYTSKKCEKEKTKAFPLKRMMTGIMKSTTRKYKKSVKCKECGMKFKSAMLLMKHNQIHGKSVNICQDCGRMYSSPLLLQEHMGSVHGDKSLKCPKCDRMFGTEKSLKNHDIMNHVTASCKQCSLSFPSKIALRTHTDRHACHTCPKCNKTYASKTSFKSHTEICGRERHFNFFCDICDRRFVSKTGLRTHIKVDHGFGTLYTCDWCDKKFDAVSSLRNHIVKHTKERNYYYCERCGDKFVTNWALLYHARLHTGERPYACDLCDECFVSPSRLMEHKRRKHWAPEKECHICKAKFVTEHALKRHVRRHFNPGSRLYVDTKCTTEGVDGLEE